MANDPEALSRQSAGLAPGKDQDVSKNGFQFTLSLKNNKYGRVKNFPSYYLQELSKSSTVFIAINIVYGGIRSSLGMVPFRPNSISFFREYLSL